MQCYRVQGSAVKVSIPKKRALFQKRFTGCRTERSIICVFGPKKVSSCRAPGSVKPALSQVLDVPNEAGFEEEVKARQVSRFLARLLRLWLRLPKKFFSGGLVLLGFDLGCLGVESLGRALVAVFWALGFLWFQVCYVCGPGFASSADLELVV